MKKAIIIIISILVVITSVSIFALNQIGNKVINEMIDSELAASQPSSNTSSETSVQSNTTTDTIGNTEPNINVDNNSNNNINQNVAEETKKQNDKKVISPAKVTEIKEKVTSTDKMTAATLVIKRLTPDDISILKGYLSGGLNADEEKKAKQIAYQRFSEEEIKQIKELYHKYMK